MSIRLSALGCLALLGVCATTGDDPISVGGVHNLRGKAAVSAKSLRKIRITPKLGPGQIKRTLVAQGRAEPAGVEGVLHLDARTTFVQDKGSLYCDGVVQAESNYLTIGAGDCLMVSFQAKPGPATYVVDFQGSVDTMGHEDEQARVDASADGLTSTTLVGEGPRHLVYILDCSGGRHWLSIQNKTRFWVDVTGIDVSVLR